MRVWYPQTCEEQFQGRWSSQAHLMRLSSSTMISEKYEGHYEQERYDQTVRIRA